MTVLLGPAPEADRFLPLLGTEERNRVARLRDATIAQRYIVMHGALRVVLSRYTGIPPASLAFTTGPFGKPALAREGCPHFSLSHSGDLGVIALSVGEVGIDLEWINTEAPIMTMAQRYFSPQEASALQALPQTVQREAFYCCWTRKEAYLKARGTGFTLPPDRFSVTVDPTLAPVLIKDELQPDETTQWHLADIPTRDGYRCTLAMRQKPTKIKHLEFVHDSLVWGRTKMIKS